MNYSGWRKWLIAVDLLTINDSGPTILYGIPNLVYIHFSIVDTLHVVYTPDLVFYFVRGT